MTGVGVRVGVADAMTGVGVRVGVADAMTGVGVRVGVADATTGVGVLVGVADATTGVGVAVADNGVGVDVELGDGVGVVVVLTAVPYRARHCFCVDANGLEPTTCSGEDISVPCELVHQTLTVLPYHMPISVPLAA